MLSGLEGLIECFRVSFHQQLKQSVYEREIIKFKQLRQMLSKNTGQQTGHSSPVKSLNMLHSQDQPITVVCRVKPADPQEETIKLEIDHKENSITITDQTKNIRKNFSFHKVYECNASQRQLVEDICEPILTQELEGKGCLIFSYGVTSSGKTHTILGTKEYPGVLLHLIRRIREIVRQDLRLTAIQLYNDQFYSLKNREKILTKDVHGFYQFLDYEPETVDNDHFLEELISHFMENRNQTQTPANCKSSRSHAIFKIQCDKFIMGVVDLAGSQRIGRGNGNLEETTSINKSLLCLGRCIQALKEQKVGVSVPIPYRQSKLTKVLMEYFGAGFKIYMIAHLNQSKAFFHENIKVLEYAAVAKQIKNGHSQFSHIIKSASKIYQLSKSTAKSCKIFDTDSKAISKSIIRQEKGCCKENCHKKCITEYEIDSENPMSRMKIINQEVKKMEKQKMIQNYLHRILGSQEEFEFSLQHAFQKEKEEDEIFLNKFRSQTYISPALSKNRHSQGKSQVTSWEQIRTEAKKKMKQELIASLELEKRAHCLDAETLVGRSLLKPDPEEGTITPTKLQAKPEEDDNSSTAGFICKAAQGLKSYIKSSTRKIYDTAKPMVDIMVESISKSNLNRRKQLENKRDRLDFASFDLYHGMFQGKECHEQEIQTDIENIANQKQLILKDRGVQVNENQLKLNQQDITEVNLEQKYKNKINVHKKGKKSKYFPKQKQQIHLVYSYVKTRNQKRRKRAGTK